MIAGNAITINMLIISAALGVWVLQRSHLMFTVRRPLWTVWAHGSDCISLL